MNHSDMKESWAREIGGLVVAGILIGIGQLLTSQEKLTWRIVLGRMISSGALGASAAGILAWLPDLSYNAQIGIACALASLGTSGLERLAQMLFGLRR